MICGPGWPGNFLAHHVLTRIPKKIERRATITQNMGQDPHNACTQLNQKQTRPNSITKLDQAIKIGTCNFWQKHSNNKLGVVIEQKKINQATKYATN